jgi:L-lactate dehydrogenase (cytochrome)
LVGHIDGVADLTSLSHWTAEQFDPALDWDDLAFVREHWDGPLVIKGVLDPEDARKAAALGAAAVVVSNHGGRQLDGAIGSLDALPGIVAALAGSDCAVWMDGGVRSGQDLIKALALGARGALIGRAWCYGLAAGGQAGVARALAILRHEMDLSMALCGVRSVAEIDRAVVVGAA